MRFVLAAVLALVAAAPAQAQGPLRAGVGRADITPPQTGYFLGGYTRADRLARGQHTRLFAKALVLEQGGKRTALLALDLFAVPAGMVQHVAELSGFDPTRIVISVTHTHSGPGGYMNYSTYNTAAPSIETVGNPMSFVELFNPRPADRQLYTFLTRQIAKAVDRAEADLGPAEAAWGTTQLVGVTRNRSVEAHLADHGIIREYGTGSAAEDPEGAVHTIDPSVDVLRVDKIVRRRRVPIGAWSNFADHGTVTKASFQAYGGDHHASAHRVFEDRVRALGRVPRSQDVVNVYGNSNEGDMSAGLDHTGPAGSDEVGRLEAGAMLSAWRAAGRRLSRRPAIDLRWTRVCFCGQMTEGGRVAAEGRPGVPFFTGSEEERGPLYDQTKVPFEGRRSAFADDAQGHKLVVPGGDFPKAAPLTVIRIGDRAIASLPGEPTKEVGVRTKARVAQALGVEGVTVAGLANDFLSYLVTPEEYDRQHYEGGSTMWGPYTSNLLIATLGDLAARMRQGQPAPEPAPIDVVQGVLPDGPPYPEGAASGTLTAQPAERVERFGHARIAWTGGPSGRDRPVESAFVVVERRVGRRWRRHDDDLGLGILWRVDDAGSYTAYWEVPRSAPRGTYRLAVTATRYRLESRPFAVVPARSLTVEPDGAGHVRLAYPRARENVDLLHRPDAARGGRVRFLAGRRTVTVRSRSGRFAIPRGAQRVLADGTADKYGNRVSSARRVG